MLFWQLVAFSATLTIFLRFAIRRADWDSDEAYQRLSVSGRFFTQLAVGSIIILSGVLTFWLPFAFGWIDS